MPYLDLPFRREESAPKFNEAEPCSIWSYFDNLDLLFIRHQVSDDSERKQASVKYTAIEVERLWKSSPSFSDPACSYEDFKVEVFQLYPEASAERQYTISGLQRLISDQARRQISSEQELGKYYRDFCLLSHNLIKMRRIGWQEQARHFLAGLQPSLVSRINLRLKAKLPDHSQ